MLDLGVRNTFVAYKLVNQLRLWLSNSYTIIKVVNAKVKG